MSTVINTLNESTLHKTLKNIYSLQNENSKQEQEIGNFIADILINKRNIIEIQTANLSSLLKKINYCIENKINITIVYPIISIKYIETLDYTSHVLNRRKSPKSENIYTIFKSLSSLISVIPNKYVTIRFIEIIMTESRLTSPLPIQSKNNQRRYKKNWKKIDKKLDSILSEKNVKTKNEWLSIFPISQKIDFTTRDIKKELISKQIKASTRDINYMVWFYKKIGLIKAIGKDGKAILYSFSN